MEATGRDQMSLDPRIVAAADGVDWDALPAFPVHLFESRRSKGSQLALPGDELFLDPTDGRTLRTPGGAIVVRAKSPPEARCILYCSYAGLRHIDVPAEPLQVFQAAKSFERDLQDSYESFVRGLSDGLVTNSPFHSPAVALLARLALKQGRSEPASLMAVSRYLMDSTMAMSYKPVFFLALLHVLGTDGRAKTDLIADRFAEFYQQRRRDDLPIEKPSARVLSVQTMSEGDVRALMVSMPLERFRLQGFLDLRNDGRFVSISEGLWTDLDLVSFVRWVRLCWRRLSAYYDGLT